MTPQEQQLVRVMRADHGLPRGTYLQDRNAEIRDRCRRGQSWRAIATEMQLTLATVNKVLRRAR